MSLATLYETLRRIHAELTEAIDDGGAPNDILNQLADIEGRLESAMSDLANEMKE
jgi:DNA-binding FrmR family transcriptional regulator